MKNKNIEELVLAWLNCHEDPTKKAELGAQLEESGFAVQQLADLEKVHGKLHELAVPEPGERMTDNFYTMLSAFEKEAAPRRPISKPFLQGIFQTNAWRFAAVFAYSIMLVFLGWSAGYWLVPKTHYDQKLTGMAAEIESMKAMMTLTLLTHSSPVERLEGVYRAAGLDKAEGPVILALLNTLNTDPNVDVRLVTIKTLTCFADNPLVRAGLVQAINTQYDSQVLLLLADVMLSLQESTAVEPMQQLLKTRVLDDKVKEQIEKTILTLI